MISERNQKLVLEAELEKTRKESESFSGSDAIISQNCGDLNSFAGNNKPSEMTALTLYTTGGLAVHFSFMTKWILCSLLPIS